MAFTKITRLKGSIYGSSITNSYSAKAELSNVKRKAESRNKSPYGTKVISVFLSHKHDEIVEMNAAFKILDRNTRVEFYVDWQDESMPENPSYETADKLRKAIEKCDKFLLLATDGAIKSRWCNWELGIGDVEKFEKDILIYPIADSAGQFVGSEYLERYPYIEEDYNGNLYVKRRRDGNQMSIDQWLRL